MYRKHTLTTQLTVLLLLASAPQALAHGGPDGRYRHHLSFNEAPGVFANAIRAHLPPAKGGQ